MNPNEALTVIQQLIDGRSGGHRDNDALQKIISCCACLRSHISSAYADEKITEIQEFADTYFSERKWQRYNGGLSQIGAWVAHNCSTLSQMLPSQDNKTS